MINLEIPGKLQNVQNMARMLAVQVFRPITRKYDKAEHEKPVELYPIAEMLRGQMRGGGGKKEGGEPAGVKNGQNMTAVLGTQEMSWGDVAMGVATPGIGLGNAAIMAVGTPEQQEQYGKLWCAMAITEPGAGSDTANISTTARLDGDEWVLNGEKIYVTAGNFCDAIVVWATLDKRLGKRAVKSFIVPRNAPGLEVVRLEPKMGFRVSDTAAITFTDCRIPRPTCWARRKSPKTRKRRWAGPCRPSTTRARWWRRCRSASRVPRSTCWPRSWRRRALTPAYERSLWITDCP